MQSFLLKDTWIHQLQQPQIIFDSVTDSSLTSHLKPPCTSSMSPEDRLIMNCPPSKRAQNVRFDLSSKLPSTSRSYLTEARERLGGKLGQSPQSFQISGDRLVSSTNRKYRQQIISPPLPFQHQQQHSYVGQYYAPEEAPPVDYLKDNDDGELQKPSLICNHGLSTNRTRRQTI